MTEKIIVCCLSCSHLVPESISCPAYPEGIPFAIFEGYYPHEKPVNGYVYKQVTEEEGWRNLRGYMGWDKK